MSVSQVRFVAPFLATTGYAAAARALLKSLLCAGFEVHAVQSDLWQDGEIEGDDYGNYWQATYLRHQEPEVAVFPPQMEEVRQAFKTRVASDAPTLFLQLPHNLSNWPQYGGGPTLGFTMTESDNLNREWRHGLRCVDMALSPSSYVTETFTRCVPEVPCLEVPLPSDPRIWNTEEYREKMPRDTPPFLFLSVFNTCERKNYRLLVQAFTEEFGEEAEEVGLILKPTGLESPNMLAQDARQAGAWVQVDTEKKKSDWAMAALYRSCDVLALPASEGQGLPFVEAALCGKPSVALSLSGSADAVTEETGYLVPSYMAPLIGHRMQWYPRPRFEGDPEGHLFASCTVDDLRATLRRCYEQEKAGQSKGEAARARALEMFTPEAVAPILRDAIEAGVEVHRRSVHAAVHPVKPAWATVAGAWGDVFVAAGNIRAMMAEQGLEQVGVIFYGKDKKIAEWLHLQPWCREVISIIQPDQKEMTKVYGRLCQSKPAHGRQAFHDLLGQRGVTVTGPIAFTQLCLAEDRPPQFWHGAVLPEEAHQWAEENVPLEKFLLLNPLSVASNRMRDHWPHWSEAITWLLSVTRVPVVLVGEQPIEWPAHPRLVNLSGQSRSMMDVLALCERSAGVVTTGNNLGIYAAIAEVPAVVVAARTLVKGNIYHQWYDCHCTTVAGDEMVRSMVEYREPFSDYQRAVGARFPQFVCPTGDGPDRWTEADFYRLGGPDA